MRRPMDASPPPAVDPADRFPPRMGLLGRVGRALGMGVALTGRRILVALAATLPIALLSTVTELWLLDRFTAGGGPPDQQDLVKLVFAETGVSLVLEALYGPVLAAMAVYVALAWLRGRGAGVYGAVNFAINRYRRQFLPHMGAWFSIIIGMMALIPGIYFLLMYAWVDAVACLEKERWPMARSKRLTRGRRKTILLVAIPWILLSQVAAFVELFWAEGDPALLLLTFWAYYLVVFAQQVSFTWLYFERTVRRKAAATR